MELKKINKKAARSYFFQYGYSSSSFEMPEYYGAENLSKIKLKKINWNGKKQVLISKTLNILTPKGFLSWRSFSLLHPYSFIHIVNEITNSESWAELRSILCRKTLVNCYSTPYFVAEDESSAKVNGISRWIQMAENDLIKDSVNYSFLTLTDIKNFYPSIYTHSIAWAINGRSQAKADRFNLKLLGNRLDRLFQSSRDGQTNGIPVGSMVSDFIAEVILKDVDIKLSAWLKKQSFVDDVLISRYRDDYRFLTKTNEQGKNILKELSKILDREYNLALNSDKTKVFDDVIEGSFRDWSNEINDDYLLRQVKYSQLQNNVTASLLKDILLKTYRLQKRYPLGRAAITLLSKLTSHLNKEGVIIDFDKTDIHTVISILRRLALIREEVSAQTYLLLDVLIKKLDRKVVSKIIDELLQVIKGQKDHDYQVIWLYRLCLSNCVEKCPSVLKAANSPLTELLKDEYSLPNPFYYDYEIFDKIDGLLPEDSIQLKKFSFINRDELRRSNDVAIDVEHYELFKY